MRVRACVRACVCPQVYLHVRLFVTVCTSSAFTTLRKLRRSRFERVLFKYIYTPVYLYIYIYILCQAGAEQTVRRYNTAQTCTQNQCQRGKQDEMFTRTCCTVRKGAVCCRRIALLYVRHSITVRLDELNGRVRRQEDSAVLFAPSRVMGGEGGRGGAVESTAHQAHQVPSW